MKKHKAKFIDVYTCVCGEEIFEYDKDGCFCCGTLIDPQKFKSVEIPVITHQGEIIEIVENFLDENDILDDVES